MEPSKTRKKKVYIVLIGVQYESMEIDSVWSIKELANKRLEKVTNSSYGDWFDIEEYEIDVEPENIGG